MVPYREALVVDILAILTLRNRHSDATLLSR